MTSIRRKLLGWLIFGFGAASAAAAYGIFHTARNEAGALAVLLRFRGIDVPESQANFVLNVAG